MKENKGITLIALVVTIIILLILAGVSITTLSGDGLFGRAQSSAAKYEQASQKENTTISSLMDKYDHYENKTTEMVTYRWLTPLAELGSFINSLTPEETRTSNFQDKEIVAIKPDGSKELINPYQAGSITVPRGTILRFYYYVDKDSDVVDFEFENAEATDLTKSGNLAYVDWMEDYWIASGQARKDDYRIYFWLDRVKRWDYDDKVHYQWILALREIEK